MATTLATLSAYAISFIIGLIARRNVADATMASVAGGFGNVGYMGPGLALATLGPEATVPVALIFSFDALFTITAVPLVMAFSGAGRTRFSRALWDVVRGILFNPLLIAAALGIAAAAYHIQPPEALVRLLQFLYASAAPCALFALGVSVALRPMGSMPAEVPLLVGVKLIVHPMLVLMLLPLFGTFSMTWISTAVLLAALPPALTAYIFARQYGTWIEQASSVVLIGTVASVVTLVGVMWLVKANALPMLMSW